jgi:hypothetical protein
VPRAEAAVERVAARVVGARPPLLARAAEAEVLGHVVAEQPAGDVVDEIRRQVGPISPGAIEDGET